MARDFSTGQRKRIGPDRGGVQGNALPLGLRALVLELNVLEDYPLVQHLESSSGEVVVSPWVH